MNPGRFIHREQKDADLAKEINALSLTGGLIGLLIMDARQGRPPP
jgi:hypothetical protein